MTSDRLSQSTEAALTERVKELTCLYGIAQIAGQPGISLEEIIQGIVERKNNFGWNFLHDPRLPRVPPKADG